ncbi:MAG: hypothetical protein HC848_04390 [Limnobacter sp.]|nr:hypothetical protein [Limnobacter sp.]
MNSLSPSQVLEIANTAYIAGKKDLIAFKQILLRSPLQPLLDINTLGRWDAVKTFGGAI